jgi:hypothetical protein
MRLLNSKQKTNRDVKNCATVLARLTEIDTVDGERTELVPHSAELTE